MSDEARDDRDASAQTDAAQPDAEPQTDGEADDESRKDDRDTALDFPVVGIGASAGGLEAFRTFLEHLPEEPGMAFVLVQHLDPEHESELPTLLQRVTGIEVVQVENDGGMALEPNTVYVIPPARNMTIDGGKLHLSEMDEPRAERAPIDHFFRSLAESQEGNAVGVVLSGSGSGGTNGLKRIKERGGITLVQDPDEAEFEGMPRSAVRMGMVDVVAPVAELAEKLTQYRKSLNQIQLPREVEDLPESDEEALEKIFNQLHTRTGNDFSHYKRSTMLRRIGRRMQVHHIEELPQYLEYLREHDDEAQALFRDLLITVTNFFRDPEAFETLREEVLPQLFEGKEADDTVRVWATGCATGEEAYSVAILLHEYAATLDGPAPEIQVFATDVSEEVIKTARAGFFPENIAADVSEERLKRFFEAAAGGYRVRRAVRESVVFARHDLMGDPPFSRLGLVVCRNLLIYLKREKQRGVFEVFHYALRPGGYLFLGSAESAAEAKDLFRAADKQHRVYRRHDDGTGPSGIQEMPFMQRKLEPSDGWEADPSDRQEPSFEEVRLTLLDEYAPPGVVVNEQREIVHVFEGAGAYLRVAAGAPTHDVLEVIRPELRSALRSSLFQARNEAQDVRSRAVPLDVGGHGRRIRLAVRPLPNSSFLQVTFEREDEEEDRAARADEGAGEEEAPPPSDGEPSDGRAGEAPPQDEEQREDLVEQLEAELNEVRRERQGAVEEHETSMEELRASNEELQSMNEELRSTTEELETSKEELQSMNEELTTVNQELGSKNEELSEVNSDLKNLLTSTRIATLFLDRDLRVQRYTPRATDVFNIIESDRGRPIQHVTRKFDYDGLEADARQVLRDLQPIEREVENEEGRVFLMQLHPYRTVEDKIDGVVLTFVDFTERKRAEEELRRSEERHRLIVENVRNYALFTLDTHGAIDTWNAGAERIFGYTEEEIVGEAVDVLFTEEERAEGVPEREQSTALEEGEAPDRRWHVRKDGTRFWADGVLTRLDDDDGEVRGFSKILRDDTDRRRYEEGLQDAKEEAEESARMKSTFIANMGHEVRTPLTGMIGLAEMLEGDLEDRQQEQARLIWQSGQRLLETLNAILSLSRLEAGQAATEPEAFDAAEEVRQTIEMQRPEADAKGVAVNFDAPAEGVPVRLDRNFLRRIAGNLVSNAIKFTREGRVDVALAANETALRLSVADTGVGIGEDFRAHLYEEFRQESTGVERTHEGSGLGLSITRKLVDLLGGRVAVESEQGEGTTFTVELPLNGQAPPDEEE